MRGNWERKEEDMEAWNEGMKEGSRQAVLEGVTLYNLLELWQN